MRSQAKVDPADLPKRGATASPMSRANAGPKGSCCRAPSTRTSRCRISKQPVAGGVLPRPAPRAGIANATRHGKSGSGAQPTAALLSNSAAATSRRWCSPRLWQAGRAVLLLDEPTRGVDVGAKFDIYSFIREIERRRHGGPIVSSDLPELLGMCDRIIVMRDGGHRRDGARRGRADRGRSAQPLLRLRAGAGPARAGA